MTRKLLSFTLRLALLGSILAIIYAFFPQRMDATSAVRLGFLSAVLITTVLLLADFVTLVFRCIFTKKKIGRNC